MVNYSWVKRKRIEIEVYQHFIKEHIEQKKILERQYDYYQNLYKYYQVNKNKQNLAFLERIREDIKYYNDIIDHDKILLKIITSEIC